MMYRFSRYLQRDSLRRIRRPSFCSLSTKTTLWCGNVVFGETNEASSTSSKPRLQQGSIDIENGTIVGCHPGEEWSEAQARNPNGTQNLGSTRTVLAPGMIDVHTHISALGRNWEGYETATKAASAGGITTLMGMPLNSIPSTTTLEAVDLEREQAAKEPLFVDVGLWGGVVPENLHQIQELLKSPYIFGLKAFLAPLPPAAGYQGVSSLQLLQAAAICGPTGKPILVHSELMAEDESLQATEDSFAKAGALSSYAAHLRSRPANWEQDAVRVVCQATRQKLQGDKFVSCRMHIVHLSDARGCLPIIQACKQSEAVYGDSSLSSFLTVETCPHYLLLDDSLVQDGDTRVKCFPPIRDAENRELLWAGLESGLIDMVASDHSPCEPSMRNVPSQDMKTAWGGLSGLQYQLQATWTNAVERKYTPIDMAKWWSEKPALLIGLANRKGRIAVGHQADLCWWDPDHTGSPNEYSQEYHRWRGTTYFADNPDMRGRVLGTWVRGNLVYDGIQDEHNEPAGELLFC
jgi:allantoinase